MADSTRREFNPADRLSPTKFEQNATMKDASVHEDPSLMRVGVSRDQITNAFGEPNETSNQDGVVQDVYEFNPDGSKFVKPKVYARNIAELVSLPAASRRWCIRPGSTRPNSSSLCIDLGTDPTEPSNQCRRSRAANRKRIRSPRRLHRLDFS